MSAPTPDLISAVQPRQPLRVEWLLELVNLYASGSISLGKFDRAGRALLRRPPKETATMIPFARAFLVAAVFISVGCGTPMTEPETAQVAPPAAKGCRVLATVDGLRCLPASRDVFWESDSQPRVFDFGNTFTVETPDQIRWIFVLTAAEPSTIRQILLLPSDAWRDSPTKIVVPHSIAEVTIPLDWFGEFFQ